MIIVSGTLRLRPESVAALRAIAEVTLRETRKEEGCILYSFAEDLLEPGLIRIYEEWETMEALDAHGRTPHIEAWREAHPNQTFVSPWRDADPATRPDAPYAIRLRAPRTGNATVTVGSWRSR